MPSVLGLGRVLGLDIGGSKTHAILAEVGTDDVGTTVPRQLADCTTASANIASVGPDEAAAALDDLAGQLGIGDPADHGTDTVYAGAAGADTPAAREQLAGLLSRRFPGARILVDHDTRIILAAGGLTAGTVLISGTGSAAWAKARDGREARAGGWGYLLGDEGSGYAVARSAVRNALRDSDDGLPAGPLTSRLLARTGAVEPGELLAAGGLTDVRVLDRAPAWGAVELAGQFAGTPHRPATTIPA